MRKLDPVIVDTLKKHGFDQSACWDCHGTWVVYHNVLEKIAAKENIVFSHPHVCSAEPNNVALCVVGEHGDRTEWSIGEASPKNCKNAYPWAMAEKRAKDRVILKLIGLAGLVYSEEEAYDLNAEGKRVWQAPDDANDNTEKLPPLKGPLQRTALAQQVRNYQSAFMKAESLEEFHQIADDYKAVMDQAKAEMLELLKESPEQGSPTLIQLYIKKKSELELFEQQQRDMEQRA